MAPLSPVDLQQFSELMVDWSTLPVTVTRPYRRRENARGQVSRLLASICAACGSQELELTVPMPRMHVEVALLGYYESARRPPDF